MYIAIFGVITALLLLPVLIFTFEWQKYTTCLGNVIDSVDDFFDF